MRKNKNKLVPHELRPANTAQSVIEQNRLSNELKKLDRDKNISIGQLAASQVVLQKSLRVMVTGGQRSAQDMADASQAEPSPVPSLLHPNASHVHVDGTPRSTSRINIIMADPHVLASKSTKSFSNHIIGGQAQLVRKMESSRNMRMSQISVGSSVTPLSRSSMGMIMDGSLYNVPETGSLTNVQFTEEDVEQGVHELHLEAESPAPSEEAKLPRSAVESSTALGEAEESVTVVVPESATGGEALSGVKSGEIQLVVPEMPAAPRSDVELSETPLTVTESLPGRPSKGRLGTASARALGRLDHTSRTPVTAPSVSPSPPVFPATISEQVYTRAVERAFAAKCLKHSKFVTDLEMKDFVTKYLLIEQQNENFKRAKEFVNQITNTRAEMQ